MSYIRDFTVYEFLRVDLLTYPEIPRCQTELGLSMNRLIKYPKVTILCVYMLTYSAWLELFQMDQNFTLLHLEISPCNHRCCGVDNDTRASMASGWIFHFWHQSICASKVYQISSSMRHVSRALWYINMEISSAAWWKDMSSRTEKSPEITAHVGDILRCGLMGSVTADGSGTMAQIATAWPPYKGTWVGGKGNRYFSGKVLLMFS